MITSICKTIVKSINASTCLKIMQALVIFHDKSALYREMYDLADVFWLENTLLCSQNESYLEQPWAVVSHLLSRADYNEYPNGLCKSGFVRIKRTRTDQGT